MAKAIRVVKKKTRTKLIKETDIAYSRYVRQKYADRNGMVRCYTCTGVYPIKKIQCGHYIPRGHKYTRWELDNLRPQCFLCNCRFYGQSFIFRANLVKELGERRVEEMEQLAKKLFREPDSWIESRLSTLASHIEKTLVKV